MRHLTKINAVIFLLGFSFSLFAQTPSTTDNDTDKSAVKDNTDKALTNKTDKISYAIGADIGRNFKNLDVPLNPELLSKGVKEGLDGSLTVMSPKDVQTTLMDFQKELVVKRQAELQQMSDQNKTQAQKYLAENKAKPGVITLADGLQYKIIKEGKGESPKDNDSVIVNYEGTFINGQVFDSSYKKGKPVTFPINSVIPGWTEALKLMKPGSEWIVTIPSELAYGEHGAGPIGPNQLLIFKIELISIQAPASAQSSKAPEKNNHK